MVVVVALLVLPKKVLLRERNKQRLLVAFIVLAWRLNTVNRLIVQLFSYVSRQWGLFNR
jgi:hypothetical protein